MLSKFDSLKVSRSADPRWRDLSVTRTIQIGSVRVGGDHPTIIAGPCAVESREQTLQLARQVAAAGGQMLRGGAFKPRTSPHSFQGLGEEGLEILAAAREESGLPVVTEVLEPQRVELVAKYADVLQVGSRNMHNFPLLAAVGACGKPVLLKRGFGSTLEEWIHAAEYIAVAGNMDIMLCERGIRTFANGSYDRATLDLAAVDAARRITPLPIIVDPSHAAGRADLVPGLAMAGLSQGAHGLLVEVVAEGIDRSAVLCDGRQGIEPPVLRKLIGAADTLAHLLAESGLRD